MTVEWKDMMLDKVAIGPVSARVYQGADYGKGRRSCFICMAARFWIATHMSTGRWREPRRGRRYRCLPPITAALPAIVFPKALEVAFSVFTYLANKARRSRRPQVAALRRRRRGGRQCRRRRGAEGARPDAGRARRPGPDFAAARSLHGHVLDPQGRSHRHARALDGGLEPLSERRRLPPLCGALPLFAYFGRCAGADVHRRGRSSARRDNWLW